MGLLKTVGGERTREQGDGDAGGKDSCRIGIGGDHGRRGPDGKSSGYGPVLYCLYQPGRLRLGQGRDASGLAFCGCGHCWRGGPGVGYDDR